MNLDIFVGGLHTRTAVALSVASAARLFVFLLFIIFNRSVWFYLIGHFCNWMMCNVHDYDYDLIRYSVSPHSLQSVQSVAWEKDLRT